jgi:hypothetical protein
VQDNKALQEIIAGRRRTNHQNCTITKHMNERNKKTYIIKIKELVIVKKT